MTGIKRLYGMACALRWYTWGQSLSKTLEEIYKQIEREQAEDHEIAEWVRERGGIEDVKARCEFAELAADKISIDGAKLQTPEFFISELDKRLMPPGMEWPKVDGNKVDFTTGYEPSLGVLEAVEIYNNGACNVMSHDGIVKSVSDIHIAKQDLIGADGLPIKKGETVWHKDGRGPWTVEVVHADTDQVTCLEKINVSGTYPPLMLTHTKPETPDSWERLEEDCGMCDVDYCDHYGLLDKTCNTAEGDGSTRHCTTCACTCGEKMARDLVRRAKALAEREKE